MARRRGASRPPNRSPEPPRFPQIDRGPASGSFEDGNRTPLASAIEQLDELTRLDQPYRALLRRVAREPPHRRLVIPLRIVVADEQDEAERVGQADVAELGRCDEREMRVPGLEGAPELGVAVARSERPRLAVR